MASRAALHKDAEIARLLGSGATTGFNSYDGVTFFNAAHVSGVSGNQDNTIAAGATDANDPTTPEFRASFKEAIQRLLTFKDDQGETLNNGASGLVAVVPPSMYVSALEALSATLLSSTTNVLQGAARVLTFPRLTATDKWYLMKTDVPVRAFIFQDREPIEFTAMERESESGFMREVYLYGVRARYKMTYGYWQHALQVTFS